ncbi:MAG: hypothetical protein OSJ63_04275 [Bacilli bacterium]|nr:hypothetical protein [Bacilli bacterium]
MVGKEFGTLEKFIEYVEEKTGYRLEENNSTDLKLKFVDSRGDLKVYMYAIEKNDKIVILNEKSIPKPLALSNEQLH